MTRLVQIEGAGDVVTLSLNRPDRHNALVPELLQELLASLARIEARNPSVLVLRANGRSFSTGGDLAGFYQHRNDLTKYANVLVGQLNRAILALLALPCPVVCAVQGAVSGGSLGLVLASDLVVMSRSVEIGSYYAEVGFSPDGGWTALLPDLIGRARVARILLTNGTINADQALAWGIASELVDGDPMPAIGRLVTRIRRLKPGSLESSRRLLQVDHEEIARRLEAERRAFVAQVQTDEAVRGVETFLGSN